MRPRAVRPRLLAFAGLATILIAPPASADSPSVRLSDAKQSGLFNSGQGGQAAVNRINDPTPVEGALKLDYTLPRGAGAGVWAKGFPAGFDAEHLDVVNLTIRGVGPDQARRVKASLELKGSSGTQVIPIDLAPESSRSEYPIEWKRIGDLNEVVVAIGQAGDEPASGSVVLDVRFEQIPWTRKLADSPLARIGGVLAVAGLLALVSALTLGRFGPQQGREASGLRRDLVQGIGTVLMAGLALAIFELGGRGESGAGWASMWFAVGGAIVATWWKFGLTGRFLGPAEVFQDALAVGLLAATASPLAILQAPTNWSQATQLSQAVSGVAAFAYLAIVANRLATTGRHPGATLGALIVGTPYVVGSLVLLSSPGMMQSLGGVAFGGWAEAQEVLGRVIVLFLFNEALAQGLSLATKRKWLTSLAAHLALLLVAAAAVAAPLVADYGSRAPMAGWESWAWLVVAVATTAFSQAGLWGEVYLVTGLLMDAIHGTAPSGGSTVEPPVPRHEEGDDLQRDVHGDPPTGCGPWGRRDRPPVRGRGAGPPVRALGCPGVPAGQDDLRDLRRQPGVLPEGGQELPESLLYARGAVVGLGLGLGLALAISDTSMATRVWLRLRGRGATYSGVNVLGDAFGRRRWAGARPVLEGLSGPGAARRVHRRGARVLLRRGPGRGGRGQVPPVSRRSAPSPKPMASRRS